MRRSKVKEFIIMSLEIYLRVISKMARRKAWVPWPFLMEMYTKECGTRALSMEEESINGLIQTVIKEISTREWDKAMAFYIMEMGTDTKDLGRVTKSKGKECYILWWTGRGSRIGMIP
jgi:hypothetical protein